MSEMMLLQRVQRYMALHALAQPADRLVVGVSGGADSLALLLLLQQMGYAVEAVHCNFHLRGSESSRDEAFVRAWCERHDVPLQVAHFDTRAYAASRHESIEMAARSLRYDEFERVRRARRAAAIAVAHHADDNAETLLLHLLRGSGLRGLEGMSCRQGHVIRPLLTTRRHELEAFLRAQGETWVTDSSNLEDEALRNRIRHHVMPALAEVAADPVEMLARAMDNVRQAQAVYDYGLQALLKQCATDDGDLRVEPLLATPAPLTLLHEQFAHFGFTRSQLQDILRAAHRQGAHVASATHLIYVADGCLCCRRKEDVLLPETERTRVLPLEEAGFIRQQRLAYAPGFQFDASPRVAYFDADKLGESLVLRHPVAGDAFRPFGMNGRKLVNDLLAEQHVPAVQRDREWLLCAGDRIAWVVGRRSSADFAVDAHTRTVLRLQVD